LPVVGAAISGYGLGVVGAWYAMVADVILRSLLILTRFLQGGWKRVRV
jgi:Na+-driven multidrug efflux pump